jgi:hypothetical protein
LLLGSDWTLKMRILKKKNSTNFHHHWPPMTASATSSLPKQGGEKSSYKPLLRGSAQTICTLASVLQAHLTNIPSAVLVGPDSRDSSRRSQIPPRGGRAAWTGSALEIRNESLLSNRGVGQTAILSWVFQNPWLVGNHLAHRSFDIEIPV